MHRILDYFTRLDDTNPVSNIERIEILAKTNITLLQTPGSNKSVYLLALNLVKILHCLLDLTLISFDVHNENEGIAILDKLH